MSLIIEVAGFADWVFLLRHRSMATDHDCGTWRLSCIWSTATLQAGMLRQALCTEPLASMIEKRHNFQVERIDDPLKSCQIVLELTRGERDADVEMQWRQILQYS